MSRYRHRKLPLRLFYSYSSKDTKLRERLEVHLKTLASSGIIADWHGRRIPAGQDWERQILNELEQADIILALLSADFLASDYCQDIEMARAFEREEQGEAVLIPVVLRPCGWKHTEFGKLQALPDAGKPVTSSRPYSTALNKVCQGIREIAQMLTEGQHDVTTDTPQAAETAEPKRRLTVGRGAITPPSDFYVERSTESPLFTSVSWVRLVWLLTGKRSGLPQPEFDDELFEDFEKFLYVVLLEERPIFNIFWYNFAGGGESNLPLSPDLGRYLTKYALDSSLSTVQLLATCYQTHLGPLSNLVGQIRDKSKRASTHIFESDKIAGAFVEGSYPPEAVTAYTSLLRRNPVRVVPDSTFAPVIDGIERSALLAEVRYFDLVERRKSFVQTVTDRTFGLSVPLPPLVVTVHGLGNNDGGAFLEK